MGKKKSKKKQRKNENDDTTTGVNPAKKIDDIPYATEVSDMSSQPKLAPLRGRNGLEPLAPTVEDQGDNQLKKQKKKKKKGKDIQTDNGDGSSKTLDDPENALVD